MSVSEPGKIITPWAESGLKNTIPPAANPATGRAGFDQGFSAINMTAKEAGGIPPFGQDFNGIFYEVTNILRYMQAGGQPTFDAALATAIGGYPKGAMVLGSDGVTLWQSRVDSNSDDPNSGSNKWILAVVQDVSTISDLRLTEPSRAGQLIGVTSYYGGWAAINGGGPEFGGRFWHDSNDTTTPDNGFTCIVTAGGKRWKRVNGVYGVGHAGAIPDEIQDSTTQVQIAINATKEGGELQFVGGPFKFDQVECARSIVLTGDARLIHNGFRIKTSNFTSKLSGKQQCWQYQSSSRAFFMRAYEDGVDYSTINILFNTFSGFFYSTDWRGREYSASPTDPTNRTVKGVNTIGCTSIAPSGVNAGHFQHTGVTNAKCIGCSTYGGINATSYNFINGNGYIIVQGCYDQDNTYGSLEIENNQVTHGVVSGNVFGKQLWIDDSSNITINGNAVADRILITAQSNDTDNITITGNSCSRISVTEFGTSPTGRHKGVHIAGNTTYGENGNSDVFADGSADRVTIENNSFNGTTDSAVAIVRSANCDHLIRNNRSRTERPLTISNVGGRIIEYGNDNMTVSGTSDSKHISNMMVPSSAYLDLPGKYLHGTKYTGSIAPGGTASIALPIPTSLNPSFRGVALWVLLRDTATNNISSFRIDGRYIYTGSAQLNFGTAYSAQGADPAAVTVANDASTATSINVLVSNTSGSKTFQVTVMPEVSSRLGTEE